MGETERRAEMSIDLLVNRLDAPLEAGDIYQLGRLNLAGLINAQLNTPQALVDRFLSTEGEGDDKLENFKRILLINGVSTNQARLSVVLVIRGIALELQHRQQHL
jgi:hypothetical protein